MHQRDINAAAAFFSAGPQLHLDWAAVHGRLWRRFQEITRRVRVAFTDTDPYESSAAMMADYRAGQLWMYAGFNEFLPREIHWALRTIHDADHCERGLPFETIGGEWAAARAAADREPDLECLWASEILGQNCTYFASGVFPAHRAVLGMSRWLHDHSIPHHCLSHRR